MPMHHVHLNNGNKNDGNDGTDGNDDSDDNDDNDDNNDNNDLITRVIGVPIFRHLKISTFLNSSLMIS